MIMIRALFCGLLMTMVVTAHGQAPSAYPYKPFKLIVPFPAGSGTDTSARRVAQELTARTGQPAIVENRPGASGLIAAQAAAHAEPDGHTLFITTNTTHGANSALFRKLPYDPVKDFEPVSALASSGLVLLVSPRSPYHDIGALIKAMRTPGKQFRFGTGNSSSRVAAELLRLRLDADAMAIPYKGTPAAMTDLMGDLFDFMFVDVGPALPLIQSGKLRALASSGPERELLMRDLPTLSESGLKDLKITVWSAAFVPAGTPKPVAEKLSELLRTIMADPSMRQLVAQTGGRSRGSTPEELRVFVASEIKKWGDAIRSAGIEPE